MQSVIHWGIRGPLHRESLAVLGLLILKRAPTQRSRRRPQSIRAIPAAPCSTPTRRSWGLTLGLGTSHGGKEAGGRGGIGHYTASARVELCSICSRHTGLSH